MAITDDTLEGILIDLQPELATTGLDRRRGGVANGSGWAEAGGLVGPRTGYAEMRLWHHVLDQRVSANLLLYRPLSRGGHTEPIGTTTVWDYRTAPTEVAGDVAERVRAWLAELRSQAA